VAVQPVPEGYGTVTPYLVVPGVAKVIDFVKRAFGAEEIGERMSRPDGGIMHAAVRIGNSRVMMGEPPAGSPAMPATLCVYVPDVDAVYQRAMAAGGTSLREPEDQFYGDRSGGVQDPAGNAWWIATHQEDVSPAELARRARAAAEKRQGA